MSLRRIIIVFIVLGLVFLVIMLALWKLWNNVRIFRNVYYAGVEDENRALDIYVQECDGKCPVIFFVHGGAWTVGDKKNHVAKGLFFARKGYVFVSVNYRLAPEITYPVFVYDVAEALCWVYEHIDEYGGDKDKIYLMGHSAGAHLVALISYNDRFLRDLGLNTSIIKGLVLLDGGGYDIVYIHEYFPVFYKTLFEKAFGEDETTFIDASPVYHLNKSGYIPPTLIIYTPWRLTSNDTQRLIDALENANASYEVYFAKDKTHSTVNRDIGKPGDKVTEEILKFLEKLNG